MTTIFVVTKDELLQVCSRIGDHKARDVDGTPNKILELGLQTRQDIFAKLFEVCMSEGIFFAAANLGKPTSEPFSCRSICLLDLIRKTLQQVICTRLLLMVGSKGAYQPSNLL